MFTLQILDRGQTLYFTPDAAETVLGSSADAAIQLTENGVGPRHARLLRTDAGLRLEATADVRVNGAVVRSHDLALGDRIEIGRAVLVVGLARSRPAGPEDVLATPRLRASRTAPPRPRRLPWLLAGAAVVVLGGLAYATGGDANSVDEAIAGIARMRQRGELPQARVQIARHRREWEGAKDDRLVRLDDEATHVEGVGRALERLEARVLDPGSGSYAFWLQELQRLEGGADVDESVAAHLVRGSLRATLDRRPAAPTGPRVEPPVANQEPAAPVVDGTQAVLDDVDRLAGQGLFAQALSVLQAATGQSEDAAGVAKLERRRGRLLEEATAALQRQLAEVDAQRQAGQDRDALTAIVLVQHRFPTTEPFAELERVKKQLEQAIAAAKEGGSATPIAQKGPDVPDAPRGPDSRNPSPTEEARLATFSLLREQLDRVRDAESGGRFAEAESLLAKAAEMAAPRDPDYATRLSARAREMHLLAACHAGVGAAVAAGRRPKTVLRGGEEAEITGVDGEWFRRGDAPRFAWADVTPQGIAMLVDQIGAAGDFALGAAAMLYRLEEPQKAEAVLATLVRAEPARKRDVDVVLARGRHEVFDERGYVLGRTGFVSVRAVELGKEAERIATRIDAAARSKDPAARQKFVDDLLARGPDFATAIVEAFHKDLLAQVDRIDKSNLRKQVDRLAEQRVELDKARQFAKDLIYDEVRYFYPYKPPAVTSDRFAEYNRVQEEVDQRIESVRRIWRDDRLQIKVPAALAADLDRLDWDAGVLMSLGGLDPADLVSIEWARALPPGDTVGIADYCATPAERVELTEWRRIEAYDAAVGRQLSASQREILRITNEYRAMFRHRPLAVSPVICNAAQGHADEMGKLGYFSHFSPTPGRRTPFDRMKLAGYDFGVSENIAQNGSAMAAHIAWLHSSGHHRNLLNPNHREAGFGAGTSLWVQNFGAGSTWLDSPDWKATAAR